jgi:hypothetical protein
VNLNRFDLAMLKPDADFLLLVAVVQRDTARQRHRPHRRLEAGIA